jgi:hypothetical protein
MTPIELIDLATDRFHKKYERYAWQLESIVIKAALSPKLSNSKVQLEVKATLERNFGEINTSVKNAFSTLSSLTEAKFKTSTAGIRRVDKIVGETAYQVISDSNAAIAIVRRFNAEVPTYMRLHGLSEADARARMFYELKSKGKALIVQRDRINKAIESAYYARLRLRKGLIDTYNEAAIENAVLSDRNYLVVKGKREDSPYYEMKVKILSPSVGKQNHYANIEATVFHPNTTGWLE